MTTKCLLKRRKAVSTVVAAVLLIAITVVAVAVVWTMVLPMLTPKSQIDIIQVTFDDTDNDGYADKITIQIQNKGSKSVNIDTSQGLQARSLEGDPRIGFDFTRAGGDQWASAHSQARYAISTTDPAPSSYPSLDPGRQVTITITLYTSGSYDDYDMYWRNGYGVQIKIYLDDGSTYTEEVTVSIEQE